MHANKSSAMNPPMENLNIKKSDLIAAFIKNLEQELAMSKDSARATYEAATHEESKPENEYDTRGLEASYLAGAQAKRANEIEEVLNLFHSLSFKSFLPNDKIGVTALVEVAGEGKKSQLLLMPKGGGMSLNYNSHHVQIVTPQSSLGEAIIGMQVGDEIEYEVGPKVRECQILGIA